MNAMTFIWFALMLIFLSAEASTINLVTAWFALGSLAAMIANFCGAELWLQGVLFFVVSAGLLALLRPITKKYLAPKIVKTNADALIGTTGRVLEPIDNTQELGRVKLGGMEWSARSTSNEPIKVGTVIRVDKIQGNKVFVSPADVPVNVK